MQTTVKAGPLPISRWQTQNHNALSEHFVLTGILHIYILFSDFAFMSFAV